MESEDWMGLSTSMLLDPDTYLFHEIGNIEDFLEPHWELPFNPDENDNENEGREREIASGGNPNGDAFINKEAEAADDDRIEHADADKEKEAMVVGANNDNNNNNDDNNNNHNNYYYYYYYY